MTYRLFLVTHVYIDIAEVKDLFFIWQVINNISLESSWTIPNFIFSWCLWRIQHSVVEHGVVVSSHQHKMCPRTTQSSHLEAENGFVKRAK